MALKNTSLKKSLSEKANDNTTVTKGTSKNQSVIKEGVPNDHSRKHLDNTTPTVGASIGTTLNMGDYESLRVDVWLTDTVGENETTQQAYERIVKVIDETLQSVVSQYR